MAYSFGAANTDQIQVTGLTKWSTKFTVWARLSLAADTTAQRAIFYAGLFFDLAGTGTNGPGRIHTRQPQSSTCHSWCTMAHRM